MSIDQPPPPFQAGRLYSLSGLTASNVSFQIQLAPLLCGGGAAFDAVSQLHARPGLRRIQNVPAGEGALQEECVVGRSLRTSAGPTLHLLLLLLLLLLHLPLLLLPFLLLLLLRLLLLLLLLLLLCVSLCAFILKVSHAPISIGCFFSMTLLSGTRRCRRGRCG